MTMNMIPEAIYNYNVYNGNGKRFIGAGTELSLPDLQAKTSMVSGSGVLGEIDSPLLGMYGSIEIDVPFRILCEEAFAFMDEQSKGAGLTIRSSQQVTNVADHTLDYKQMRVVIRGRNKGINLGKLKQGESMDCSIKVEVTYLLVEIEGVTMFELDKFNEILVINGKDQLGKIRGMC